MTWIMAVGGMLVVTAWLVFGSRPWTRRRPAETDPTMDFLRHEIDRLVGARSTG